MLGLGSGLWIIVFSMPAAGGAPADPPPRSLDSRLIFERIAAEPEIVTPTGIAVDRQRRILVVESHTHFRPAGYQGPPADRVRLFEDRDHDGKPECVGSFVEGTRMTMSVAVAQDGSVFIASRSALYRFEDRDGNGRADGTDGGKLPAPFVRLDTRGDYPHNGLSGFAFDCDGTVYFGLGENLGADYRLMGSDGATLSGGGEGGNIYRCRPDGSKLERVATGFWNPFHVAFDAFGRLFAVDNDPDSRPPCRLLHIVDGGDYGYRFRNGRKGLHPFTAWNGELPGTLGMVAGTGEAPCGVLAYESDQLPEDYRGTLLVTSWGDHRIEQYRLEPRGASFRATMKPVVAGGEDFRPVGIATAPDGSLYVSDWVDKSYTLHGQGRIWRLRSRRAAARGKASVTGSMEAGDRPRRRAAALKTIVTTGGPQTASEFLKDESADVRALAVRLLPAERIDLMAIAVADPSSLVRAGALRRLADPAAKDILLKALDSEDPFIRQAARLGLSRSLTIAKLATIADAPVLPAARRLGVLLILRDSDRPAARRLLPRFMTDTDPLVRLAAIRWVGEHRLEAFRPALLAGLTTSGVTRNQFEATLAALELLDGKARTPTDEVAGEDYIAALLRAPGTPRAVLRRGLRMLRPDHPALTTDLLRRLSGSPDEGVRVEAVRSLCQSPHAGRFAILAKLADDQSVPLALRAEAIVGLAPDAPRQRERLLKLAECDQPVLRREALRGLRSLPLSPNERTTLQSDARDDAASRELLDLLARPDARIPVVSDLGRATGASVDTWLARLDGPADAAAGERVFFHSKGPGCYLCHQVDGRGGRTGPDLSTQAAVSDRRRLVESIVAPSKEIAPQFVTWSVARTDGTVVTGVLLEESPEGALVLADSQGRRVTIKADEISERKPQAASIMPADLVKTMTVQEFRDLVAFLSGQSAGGRSSQ
ncbi:MAG: PVC-type heme-binding CxxCH protein [Isosphaeraceae bacterium]